jgi:CHAT domain-containing protein/Flp pilus assembly protein TadD
MNPSTILSSLSFPFPQSFAQPLFALLLTLLFLPLPLVPAQTAAAATTAAQREAEPRTLKLGEPIERELAGGQQHSYQLALTEGQYLNLAVEQRGVDVVVALFAPNGKKLIEVNDTEAQGIESVTWIVETSGRHRLEVRAIEPAARPGQYQVKLAELRAATSGDRDLAEADKLNGQIVKLYQEGQYDQAISPAKRALALHEKTLGPEHPETATSLNNLAMLYESNGDYGQAEPLSRRALAINEKVLGAEHPATATSLNNLAGLYRAKGDYGQAEPLYNRALAIREKVLGSEHPSTATSLNNLAALYESNGDFEQAEPLSRRALAINEKVLGAEHPATAASLNNLALLYYAKGDYGQAEPLYHRALAIYEKVLGSEHPSTANSLNNLAGLYESKGDYGQAEPLHRRVLAIYEKVLGAEHPATANSLNNLALLYESKGDYGQAEPLYRRAFAIREKVLGAEHPLTAASLNNLAGLYSAKGDYGQAEPLYHRALAICEKVLGSEHPYTAASLNNLAGLYESNGDYGQAEPLSRRALAINEKVLGAEHPATATSLSNLAGLYRAKGDYGQAEPLYNRALAIRKKVLGSEHPSTATSLNNLAGLYESKGDYGQAEPLYHRALAIREKVLGAEHPDTANSLNNLATLYQAKNDIPKAISFRVRAQAIEEHNISLNLATGSERQKLAYLNSLGAAAAYSVRLHVRLAPADQTARDLALTVIWQRKGRVLEALNDSTEALRRRANPQDRALLDQLKSERAQLGKLVLGGLQKASPTEYQQAIKRLEESVEKLEAELGNRSAEFRIQSQPVTIAAVQAVIPTDAALIEFYRYDYKESHYVAYVLRQRGEAQWVDLGEAGAIDEAISKLRLALRDKTRSDVKQLARVVDAKVMQPVRPLLGQTQRVLLSPDGALSLVPFAALVDEKNHYLAENYEFSYLTSGRDLLRLQVKQPDKQSVMVVANPDFGDEADNGKAQERILKYRPGATEQSREGGLLSDYYFPPLSGTAEEARELKALMNDATVLTQAQATEAALKRVSSPRILHVATHGFFLEDLKTSAGDGRDLKQVRLKLDETPVGKIENPLLRSGLALAGANLQKGSDGNDGILTAQEVAGLDLFGTKLVVLSACDTGVGEVKNGEGVYGLRRALVLAGSETQVMSLWPVSDKGTRDLMIEYYRRLLRGEGRSAALRAVQLQMLKAKAAADEDEDRLLVAKSQQDKDRILKSKTGRKSGERSAPPKLNDYSHPYYWASFIQSGEWANLQGNR